MFVQPIGNINKPKFGINLSIEDFKCQTKINKKPKKDKRIK